MEKGYNKIKKKRSNGEDGRGKKMFFFFLKENLIHQLRKLVVPLMFSSYFANYKCCRRCCSFLVIN